MSFGVLFNENKAVTNRLVMKKRTRIATAFLLIELLSLAFFFLVTLKFIRERYWESAVDSLSDRVVNELSMRLWMGVTVLTRYGRNVLEGEDFTSETGALSNITVKSFPDPALESSMRKKIPLSGEDDLVIYIGYPKLTLERGFVIPFAVRDRLNLRKNAYGDLIIPGITEFLDGLTGRNVFCRLTAFDTDKVIYDSTDRAGDFRLKKLIKGFREWEEFIPFFDIKLTIKAPENAFHVPLAPQVFVLIAFSLLVVAILALHVRVVKPSSMTQDLLAEKREELDLGKTEDFPSDNLYLQVSSLSVNYEKLKREREELMEKLKALKVSSERDLEKKYNELLTHHTYTKKMMKALNKENVLPILVDGIKELGFKNCVYGIINRETRTVDFRLDPLVYGRTTVSIPLRDETFFISRVIWSGIHHFVKEPIEIEMRYDDSIVLGNQPFFISPIVKNRRIKCYQYFQCDRGDCPSYMSGDGRCWVRQGNMCYIHSITGSGGRDSCIQCPMFLVEGVVVVKSSRTEKLLEPSDISPVNHLISESSLALEIAELYEETEKMSITDGLTGLYNHREFYRLLEKEVERSRRYGTDISVLMIDVDNFKIYNDTYGHMAGDMALRKIADAIKSSVRKLDIVARYGGEEFAVILPETNQAGAVSLAERIKNSVSSINFSPEEDEFVRLTVSIGVCSMKNGELSPDKFISRADDAAYLAKKTGKNKICVADSV